MNFPVYKAIFRNASSSACDTALQVCWTTPTYTQPPPISSFYSGSSSTWHSCLSRWCPQHKSRWLLPSAAHSVHCKPPLACEPAGAAAVWSNAPQPCCTGLLSKTESLSRTYTMDVPDQRCFTAVRHQETLGGSMWLNEPEEQAWHEWT